MKKQFQSKSVPRGTRTLWRYLGALILLFSLGIGQMWAEELCSATLNGISSNSNTTGIAQTGCTMKWNSVNSGSDVVTIGSVSYYKFSGSSSYVQLVLSSGKFKAGDELTVTLCSNAGSGKTKSVQYSLHSDSGNKSEAQNVGSAAPSNVSYTLVAADIESDGSIKIFRGGNTNIRFGSFSVTRSSGSDPEPTDVTAPAFVSSVPANSATDVAVEGTIVLTFSEAIASVDGSKFTLTGATKGTVAIDGTDATKVNVPYSDAANEATVTLKVSAEAVADAAGNKSAALSDIAFTTVATAAPVVCPTSGQLYSAVTTATSSISIATTDGLELNSSTHKTTVSGGKMYVISKQSSAKNLITNGAFCQTNNDTYFKVELDCALEEGDVISINVGKDGSNDRGVWVSTATSRPSSAPACALTAKSSSLTPKTYTVTSTDEYVGKKVFYIYRATGNSTYFNNVVITRPYSVSYDNLKEAAHTMPAKAVEFTLQELTNATFNHTGWTADKLVKVGGVDKAAGTALGKTDVVTLTDNTTFTATWEAKVTKYTVTYYDGEAIEANKLGSELVNEGSNPTATGIVAPHKLGYSFAGWSTTNGGDATALSGISVAADMPLYAVYNAVNCSALSGKIFEVNINVAPAANCTIRSGSGYETSADLIKYGTVSGGIAIAENSSTSNHLIITTTPTVKFAGGNGYVHISFDCALKVGDKIKTTIASQNIAYTTTSSRSTTNYFTKGTDQELTITSGHPLENATEIYLWAASSNGGELTSLQVIRPEKFEVTFNMHDHGDAVAKQYILDGGKVTKPTDPTASGWDFGGWFATYVADPESYDDAWDFDNDVVSAATELHAKWTEHVLSNNVALGTLTVNGEDVAIVPSQLVYAVELPFGTTAIPTVAATAADANAKACNVTQASAVNGSATIYVKAEDNTTEATYTINFSVATSKDIELVWDKSKKRCDDTTPTANVKSDDASVSAYINKITFTGGGAEGSSLNVGNTAGNMFTLSAKAGYAFQALSFFGKIQDATCEYSLNGGAWTELASTKTDGDKCYSDVFSAAEVHEFRLRSTGNSGVWIRNMQLTIIKACTPIVVAWDEGPVEFEVGKAGYAIAATANNGGTISYASADNTIIDANASTGALTIAGLGSVALSASTPEGDGSTYCANGGDPIVLSKVVNTYYLVKFDGQNGEAADEVKYFSGDAAIALPAAPSYPGYDFQGWFDAETGGNQYTAAINPTASMTVYAQWVAQCAGATIITQPTGASYLTGRTPVTLVCEATAGNGGALTYEWFTCDDAMKTNPVAATATPSTAVAGTFYYFCKVTEEGCDVEAFSNVVTITVTDKTPICLIATTVTGAKAHGAVTGIYGEAKGGSADVNVTGGSYKMDKGTYIGVTLPEGYKFQEGDKVVLNVMTVNNATGFTLFDGKDGEKNLIIDTRDGALVPAGENTVVLPAYAGSQSVYVLREDNSTTGNLNSAIDAIAVYRTCAPNLNKVTVNGAEGKPNALNQVVFEVAASTTQAQLEDIAFDWVSNDDAWTAAHAPVAANAWEFGVANEVTFTDKDGDQSVYTITVNKAVPSSDATLSALSYGTPATAIALADGVYEYNVELPYGTSSVPVLAATAHHAGAEITEIDDAEAFVNRQAISTVTVTAEDNTELVYTVNFTVSRYESKLLWDGSTMTALSEITAAATAAGVSVTTTGISVTSFSAKTCEENGKSYTKALDFGGKTQSTRYFGIEIPAGKVAKVSLVYRAKSTSRSIIVATALSSAIDESTITSKDAVDGSNLYMMKADMFGGGTLYINTTDGFHVHEISIQLADGYARSAMLGAGVYGTICVDHNVNVADIQGVTVYELMGREPQYGKLAFDEIVSGELEAGAPYVFQAHRNHMALLYGETSVAAPVDKGNGMYGTFTDQTLTELDDVYYFAQRALWSCVDLTSLSLPANRAYVKLSEISYLSDPNPAPGRRRVTMAVNGEAPAVTTGMDNLNAGEQPVKMIINGQLFILRGEKMYDVTGKLVK